MKKLQTLTMEVGALSFSICRERKWKDMILKGYEWL